MTAPRPHRPSRRGRSFTTRLMALVIAANAFAIVLAALALTSSYHHQRATAETVSQNLAQVLEFSIAAQFERVDDALTAVADEILRQEAAGTPDANALHALMVRQMGRTPGIVGLRAAGADGLVRHIVGGNTTSPPHVTDRDYFVRLRDQAGQGMVISEPVFGRITNQWIIVLARRVEHPDGSFAGVVFAPLALDSISRTFATLNLGEHGAVSLRDTAMRIIARYPDTGDKGQSVIGSEAVSAKLRAQVDRAARAATYEAQTPIDHVNRIVSYRRIAGYPLYILVGLATGDQLHDWWAELTRTVLLLLLFVPLTLWASRWALHSWREEEAALEQASEASARLGAVLGGAPIGLAIVDADRRILEANDALAAIFTIRRDQLYGKTTQELYASRDEFETLGARAYPIVRTGATFGETVPMQRRNGEKFWCKLTGRQVDPALPELGYVWIFEDITEQIATTEALRASEERFRVLVDGVRDYAILRLDPDGRVLTWNQGAQAIKGYEADEIIGRSFECFYTPEDVAAGLPDRALEMARDCGRYEAEGWRVRKDGSRFWASLVMTALHDADGRVHGFAKITRDITEQRRSAREIQRLASYQKAILDNTPVGIAILSLDRTIIQANGAFCRIYGRDGEDLAGQQAAILYADPIQSQDVKERAYPMVQAGGTFADDVLMSRRDGTRIWVRLFAHLVDLKQPELGVVWAAQDISAQKELHENLIRSNAELERFAYVASHDLRQPLRMISSYTGLIERRLRKDQLLDDEMRDFLDYVIDGAKRMDRMIVDMLDYSRIGRQSSPIEDVPLSLPLERALTNLAEAVAEAGAQITVPPDLPTVTGSTSELERLFQNLIGNAIKFRAENRPPRVEIRWRDTPTEWIVSVADNGIGIDPSQHERLFALFSRLVSNQQYEGTGIGLASCRKIAEHHGGRIWVESPPEGGSIFHVALARRRN